MNAVSSAFKAKNLKDMAKNLKKARLNAEVEGKSVLVNLSGFSLRIIQQGGKWTGMVGSARKTQKFSTKQVVEMLESEARERPYRGGSMNKGIKDILVEAASPPINKYKKHEELEKGRGIATKVDAVVRDAIVNPNHVLVTLEIGRGPKATKVKVKMSFREALVIEAIERDPRVM